MATFPERPKRILLLARDMMGDLVNTTGAVHSLVESFPDSDFTLECGEAGVELFVDIPRLQVWPRKRHGGLASKAKRILAYRHGKFDLAIILTNSHEFARMARLGGVPFIVGCHKGKPELFDLSVEFDPSGHDLFNTLEGVLKLCGVAPNVEPQLPSKFYSDQKWDKVGAYIGSSDEKKSWPMERWIEFAELASAAHGQLLLMGSLADRVIVETIAEKVGGAVLPLPESLAELSRMVSALKALVVADTGPAHLAAASGTPVVILYGPTDPARFHPYGTNWAAVRENDQCEHYGKGCDYAVKGKCPRTCMKAIEAKTVVTALHNLLNESDQA